MAHPLAVYVTVRQDAEAQLAAKVYHEGFKIFSKPVANTFLIHFSRVVLVPDSADNFDSAGAGKKIKAAMLITTYDNGMMPYFLAFWQSKSIRDIFEEMRSFAVDPPPKLTGDEYMDYTQFENWLGAHNIQSNGFYCAYPQTLTQIYQQFPEQDPSKK